MSLLKILISALLVGGLSNTPFAAEPTLQSCAESVIKKLPENQTVVKGKNGWLFLRSELEYLAKGKFWTENIQQNDATAAILDFNNQLKTLGIQLILVPVPTKAEIYPDEIFDKYVPSSQNSLYDFYKLLGKNGVTVLDLYPLFSKEARLSKDRPVYCLQDSHWSGQGIELTTTALANMIKKEKWYKPQKNYSMSTTKVEIKGDLATDANDVSIGKESLVLKKVAGETINESSPVLVIGDSHTLIFHSGDDMLAEKSGLVDLLAAQLGMPVDLIGVRGSGSTSVRVNLYRKSSHQPEWLKNKKLVIWCFSAREFTQSQNGWKKIPILKN